MQKNFFGCRECHRPRWPARQTWHRRSVRPRSRRSSRQVWSSLTRVFVYICSSQGPSGSSLTLSRTTLKFWSTAGEKACIWIESQWFSMKFSGTTRSFWEEWRRSTVTATWCWRESKRCGPSCQRLERVIALLNIFFVIVSEWIAILQTTVWSVESVFCKKIFVLKQNSQILKPTPGDPCDCRAHLPARVNIEVCLSIYSQRGSNQTAAAALRKLLQA